MRPVCSIICSIIGHDYNQTRSSKIIDRYDSIEFPFEGIPAEDCSDGDVWGYAISFRGYSWTMDMHKEGKIEPLLSEESIDFLNI